MAAKKDDGTLTKADLKACFADLHNEWREDLKTELQTVTHNLQEAITSLRKDTDQLGARLTGLITDVQSLSQDASAHSDRLHSLETHEDTLQLTCEDLENRV